MLYGKYQIDEQERNRRIKANEYAVASIGLEGYKISAMQRAIDLQYIDGNLTRDEFKQKNDALLKASLKNLQM